VHIYTHIVDKLSNKHGGPRPAHMCSLCRLSFLGVVWELCDTCTCTCVCTCTSTHFNYYTGLIETSKTHFYGRAAAGPSFSEGILRTFTAPRAATSFY
jgi:hypothetical protein